MFWGTRNLRTQAVVAIAAIAVIGAALVPTAGAIAQPGSAGMSSAVVVSDDVAIAQILADTNAVRASAGKAPLRISAAMNIVSTNWSRQMATAKQLSHNPNYTTEIPSGWSRAAENVAYGQRYDTVVAAWAASPGHLANMTGDYTDIGIGVYELNGQRYFTQNFGKYATAPAAPPAPAAVTPPTTSPDGSVEVYRFWSPRNSTHFFTASVAERDSIIASYPTSVWTYEGVAYRAFPTQVAGSIPLYRFWSPRLSGHFFTANPAEKDSIIANYPASTWSFEGVAYYVYPSNSSASNTVAVSRFWSPKNQHHFYTASAGEKNSVIAGYPSYIWTYEGDTFRVPAS